MGGSEASVIETWRRLRSRSTHRLRSMPVLILMPHGGCNCRCVMCDIWKANERGERLPAAEIAAHLASWRRLRVRRVVLSGGEPLMHPDLWEVCAGLKVLPARITILSTGLLLAREAPRVVEHCDEAIVSLDGGREVHDAIRNVPRAFDRLAEGVRAVKAIDPRWPVTGRCVLQRRNYADLPGVIEAARAIGLDRISFLAADVTTTAFNRAEPWSGERAAEVALNREEAAEFARIVEDAISRYGDLFASGFIAESPEKLRRLPRYYAALAGAGDFPRVECNAPWVSAVVEADGTVRPCFFHRALGNIRDAPFEKIVNAPEAIAFRRGLDVTRDPVCRRCVCTLRLGPRTPV